MQTTSRSKISTPLISLCFAAALGGCATDETIPDANQGGSGSNGGSNTNVDLVTPVACNADDARMQEVALALINEARSQARMCGNESKAAVPAVSWDNALKTAATNHSTDMSSVNFFSHTGSNGSEVGDRATAQNYSWRAIGENIAAGQTSVQVAIQGWIDSPGHCVNLMSPLFTEVAVSCVSNSNSQYNQYWTNVLGDPQ